MRSLAPGLEREQKFQLLREDQVNLVPEKQIPVGRRLRRRGFQEPSIRFSSYLHCCTRRSRFVTASRPIFVCEQIKVCKRR